MSGASIEHRCRVAWVDTDAAGIHHHTAIARYVESAEAALVRGLGLEEYFGRAPRVHWEVDFEAPLRFDQEVVVQLQVERVGASSLTLAFEVSRDGVRAARGRYTTVHVPSADGRPTPWPEAWRRALTADA